ncbi:hypothetical protein ABZ894_18395 [Nocardia beijingensis]|uniref:hypothetical protein n=1 Tax=Nocardia beijingensis TaxID=95162 RepID=UPI0033E99D35
MADESGHPFLRRLTPVVGEIIAPAAVRVDSDAVPAGHFTALGGHTDLLRVGIASRWGGTELPVEVEQRAWALLAAACPSTHLIAQQHSAPARWLHPDSAAAAELLPRLAAGELVGAAAFGHVRNWPRRRDVTATRVRGGWRFDGVAPWLSGWGLASLLAVAAVEPGRSGSSKPSSTSPRGR